MRYTAHGTQLQKFTAQCLLCKHLFILDINVIGLVVTFKYAQLTPDVLGFDLQSISWKDIFNYSHQALINRTVLLMSRLM